MRQIKKFKRATIAASTIFGLSQGITVAHADELALDVVTKETLAQQIAKIKAEQVAEARKTDLEKYEDKVTEETSELHILKTRQQWLPKQATIEKLNIDNRIRAQEKVIQLAEQDVQAEKDRIAEEQRKAEEARLAEEQRKAEEARIAEEQRKAEEQRLAEEAAREAEATQQTTETYATYTAPITASSVQAMIVPTTNTYPWGQCTWGVKVMADWVGPYWGNANQWVASAAAEGYAIGDTPVAGSVMVFLSGAYGHVAYVTDVDASGNIQILESNFGGNQSINNYRGWFNPYTQGPVKFIYPK